MVKKIVNANATPLPVIEVSEPSTLKEKTVDSVPIKKSKKSSKPKTPVSDVVVEKNVEVETVKLPTPEQVTPVIEETEDVVELSTVDENAEVIEEVKEKKRTRRLVTKESFYHDFEAFVESFDGLLESFIKGDKVTKNSKNGFVKKLKQLQNDSIKLLKIRNLRDDKKPKSDNNSGFMKPIKISDDLASFLNANPEEPITRVHVTKKLCQYIKEKDLQNPQDRREIIPDEKLNNLFRLQNSDQKLTYYSMQKAIQQHIFKL